jgi:hypothetical protein
LDLPLLPVVPSFFLVERVKPVFQLFVFAPLFEEVITGEF